ncbi:hypothetical protein BDF14DRAFT_1533447 [Spinellus fusiger]|nr:hypothetical protein BDF14DRAFT_1533447 [Spinellus fusiger]
MSNLPSWCPFFFSSFLSRVQVIDCSTYFILSLLFCPMMSSPTLSCSVCPQATLFRIVHAFRGVFFLINSKRMYRV